MQTAGDAFCKHVMPHPPGAVGSIAGNEAGPDLGAQLFIAATALTARSPQPGIEATPRDTERPAQPIRRPDPPVLRNETELHVDSLAKQAAAFFRMSRSAFSLATSRLSRAISACSGFICPWPGKACDGSSANALTQLRSWVGCTPRSCEACA